MLSSEYVGSIVHEVFDEPVLSFVERWGWSSAEFKEDGERVLVEKRSGRITLANRRKTVYTEADLPAGLVSGLKKGITRDGIYDGEFATTKVHERALYDFLSGRAQEDPNNPLRVVLFDVLEIDGTSTLKEVLSRRRKLLEECVQTNPRVRLSQRFRCNNWLELSNVFEDAIRQGYEGIVIKAEAPYEEPGSWVKWKTTHDLDVAVLGIHKTKTLVEKGLPESFLIGARSEQGDWIPLGHVSAGLSKDQKQQVGAVAEDVTPSYLDDLRDKSKEYIRLKPHFVFAITCMRILRDGEGNITLREPRIVRVRLDKKPEDCSINQFGDDHKTQAE